jgi:hypothetical protein
VRFLAHEARILLSSRIGSGIRPFHKPRAFSQIASRSFVVMSGYMRELEGDGERLAIGKSYITQPLKETEFTGRGAGSGPRYVVASLNDFFPKNVF